MGDKLSAVLAEKMRLLTGHGASPGEVRSWNRSAQALAADLVDAGLSGVEILLEYKLPFSSKRADVVLAGKDAKTGENKYVIVELKQWSDARRFEDSDDLVTIEGYGPRRPVTHPSEQVRSYCDYVRDYTASLAETPNAVEGVVYLHNATDFGVADLFDSPAVADGRLFTGQHRGAFVDFLKSKFAPEGGAEAADHLLSSKLRPQSS